MKTIYQKPQMKIVVLHTEYKLLAGSDVAVGAAYQNGDAVLSRRSSLWDEDEE